MRSQPPTWAVSGETGAGSGVSPWSPPGSFTPQVCLQLRPAETKARRAQEVKTNSLRKKKKKSSHSPALRKRKGRRAGLIPSSTPLVKGAEAPHGSQDGTLLCAGASAPAPDEHPTSWVLPASPCFGRFEGTESRVAWCLCPPVVVLALRCGQLHGTEHL